MHNVGEAIVRLMKDRKLTVRETAERVGVSVSTLQSWRSGVTPTDFVAVLKLAKLLGVSLTWLLTGEKEPAWSPDALLKDHVLADGYYYVLIKKVEAIS